jgi:hypothetical protein
MTYKLYKNRHNKIAGVYVIGENKSIPADPDNTDYQEYLEWVAEGNTPEPADEVTE